MSVSGKDHTECHLGFAERMHPTHSNAGTLEVALLHLSASDTDGRKDVQ